MFSMQFLTEPHVQEQNAETTASTRRTVMKLNRRQLIGGAAVMAAMPGIRPPSPP